MGTLVLTAICRLHRDRDGMIRLRVAALSRLAARARRLPVITVNQVKARAVDATMNRVAVAFSSAAVHHAQAASPTSASELPMESEPAVPSRRTSRRGVPAVIAPDGTHHVSAIDGTPLYRSRFASVLAFHHPPGLAPAQFLDCTVTDNRYQWGHIDTTGSAAYAARFARTFGFYEGLAAVDAGTDGWHHILPDGSPAYQPASIASLLRQSAASRLNRCAALQIGPGWSWCGNFQHDRCPVRFRYHDGHQPDHHDDDAIRGGRFAYTHIDPSGAPRTGGPYAYAGDFREGFAVVRSLDDGLCRHVDRDGQSLLAPEHVRYSIAGGASTTRRTSVSGAGFLDLDVFHKGYARARDAGGWFFLRRDGIDACDGRRFAEVEPFYNGQALVRTLDGQRQVVTEDLHIIMTMPDIEDELQNRLQQLSTSYWHAAALRFGLQRGLPELAAVGSLIRPAALLHMPSDCKSGSDGGDRMLVAVAEAWRELGLLRLQHRDNQAAADDSTTSSSMPNIYRDTRHCESLDGLLPASDAGPSRSDSWSTGMPRHGSGSSDAAGAGFGSRYELTATGRMLLPGSPQREKAVYWTQDRYLRAWLPVDATGSATSCTSGSSTTLPDMHVQSHNRSESLSSALPKHSVSTHPPSVEMSPSRTPRSRPKDSFAAISRDPGALRLARRVWDLHAAADWAGIENDVLPRLMPLRQALGRPLTVVDVGGGAGTLLQQLASTVSTPVMMAPTSGVDSRHRDCLPQAATKASRSATGDAGAKAEVLQGARLICFDRPEVAALNVQAATRGLGRASLALRLEHVGGDIFDAATIPAGADVYLLSRVLHDWDDPWALQVLQAVKQAARSAPPSCVSPQLGHHDDRDPRSAADSTHSNLAAGHVMPADGTLRRRGSSASDSRAGSPGSDDTMVSLREPLGLATGSTTTPSRTPRVTAQPLPLLIVIDRVASAANAHAMLSLHMHVVQGSRERWAAEWAALFDRAGWWMLPLAVPVQSTPREATVTGSASPVRPSSAAVASCAMHNGHAIMVLTPAPAAHFV